MRVKKAIAVLVFIAMGIESIFSQTFNQPNIALKSHETLEILKVEISSESTVLYLSIENRIVGGNFCADRNIFIIYPDGTRIKLVKSAGIPECPDTHVFRNIGEKLGFTLTFPPLKSGTKWIDVIENCTGNCFSFYGVTLDNELNDKLNEAFSFADRGEDSKAILALKNILGSIESKNLGIEGALYADIISLTVKTGDTAGGEILYKKMLSSGAPRLDLFIRNLNNIGIKY